MENLTSESVSISDIEAAVLKKAYQEAIQYLNTLIIQFDKQAIDLTIAPFDRVLTPFQKEIESYQVIEKLASVMTSWFSDPSWTIGDDEFLILTRNKRFMNSVFAASSYHSTDHIVNVLGLSNKSEYTSQEIRKLLVLITPESDLTVPWATLIKVMPRDAGVVFCTLLAATGICFSSRVQLQIDNIISELPKITPFSFNDIASLSSLVSVYFLCSNFEHPKKYNLKEWVVLNINHNLNRLLSADIKERIGNVKNKKITRDKPTLLIIHERYSEGHAMHRGHQPRLMALKNNFHVIGMVSSEDLGPNNRNDFHELIEIADSEKYDVELLANRVLDTDADIILYPSVGMTMFGPCLASLRLAPIQVASAGHPSSTYFETIDYFHCIDVGQTEVDMKKVLREKHWLPNKRKHLVRKERSYDLSKTHLNSSVTNIVVNGVIQKVTKKAIELCQEIGKKSEGETVFHFFMANPKQSLEYYAAKSLLRRFLPNSEVHSFKSYSSYMSILNDCDFAIPTIPFGGTNSNADLIEVNKPKLFITDKSDISGMSDLDIWQTVGFLEGHCESTEELVKKAVHWVQNPEELANVCKRMETETLEYRSAVHKEALPENELSNELLKIVAGRRNG